MHHNIPIHENRMFRSLVTLMLVALCLSAVQGRRLCHPTNVTISAEKEDCPICFTLTTTICSGYCLTRDPVFKNALSSVYQNICTYNEIRYDTIKLPDCLPGTDPFFTYPVAVSCKCNQCKMDYSDCTVQSIGPDFCSNSLVSQFQLIN
ncbi:lutropin subunit beta-like isoform X1 [Xenopus laevis]|uniref:Lutropin subunit beta-like isoform X1 n=2 Tax=Xenopus laevis TaxID=8355 RepID=A0A8J1LEV5_XENLA|nr:lutropin subunit beta-like isoform X1 [Xenopus laevis]